MLVRYYPVGSIRKRLETQTFAEDLLRLLNGVFTHHEFEPVRDWPSFRALWKPFAFNRLAELRRREDRFVPFARVPVWDGGRATADDPEGEEEESIYFVYPFVPTDRTMERLLVYLLRQPQPFVIDVLLQPTQLRTEEEALIVHSLRLLDRVSTESAQVRKSVPSSLSRSVATFLSSTLLSQYSGFLDAPFLVRTVLASPKSFGPHVAHSIGVEFTEPAGGTSKLPGHPEDLFAGQTGGFDVLFPEDDSTRKSLASSVAGLTFHDWGFTLARTEEEKRLRYLFDPVEASSVFRLPSPSVYTVPGLTVHITRVLPLPPEAVASAGVSKKEFVVLGVNPAFGSQEPVQLWRKDRREHVYIVGQTGTGKSSLIYSMLNHDIWNNDGVGLIDPHGDLFRLALRSIPPWRTNDVVILDPTDTEHPFALNPIECRNEFERDFIIQEMIAIARRIYDPQGFHGIAGPVFEDTVRSTLVAVMTAVQRPTFAHFLACLTDKDYRSQIRSVLRDRASSDMSAMVATATLDNLERSRDRADYVAYVGSKFGRLLTDRLLRNITLQPTTSVDFQEIMDKGKILLVNLNRGQMGLLNAEWLGMFLMMRLELAALRRGAREAAERRDFFLYIDEFQNVASASFAELLGEARKFRLNLTLAHQYYTQVPFGVGQSILGNVGTIIAFRLGLPDAEKLVDVFYPTVSQHDLSNQPNFEATVSMVRDSERVRPFTVRTLKPEPPEEVARSPWQLIEASRKKYTRPRRIVEFELRNILREIGWLEEEE